MTGHAHEIEIRATNAAGETAIVHAEFAANDDTPAGAAHECFDAVVKEFGKDRMREIDPAI